MHRQHLKNTQAAISAWKTVPPEAVSNKLLKFRESPPYDEAPSCGSPACFGGHLPYFPHFAALGVVINVKGAPTMHIRGQPALSFYAVSSRLFGNGTMFEPMTDEEGTPHQVVMHRLITNLHKLQSA